MQHFCMSHHGAKSRTARTQHDPIPLPPPPVYGWVITLLLDDWKRQSYPHLGRYLGVWKALTENGLPRQKMVYISLFFVWPPVDILRSLYQLAQNPPVCRFMICMVAVASSV